MFNQIPAMTLFLKAFIADTKKDRDERGASDLITMVIVAAILAAAAIAICTIIVTKFTSKANSIPTE